VLLTAFQIPHTWELGALFWKSLLSPKIGTSEAPLEFKAPSFKATEKKYCFFQNVSGREESSSAAVSFSNKEKQINLG